MRWVVAFLSVLAITACQGVLAAPTPTPKPVEAPFTIIGRGIQDSRTFPLAGGNYTIRWAAMPQSGNMVGCYNGATLKSPDNSTYQMLVNADVGAYQYANGETNAYNIRPGRYYVSASSGCDWSFTFTPQ